MLIARRWFVLPSLAVLGAAACAQTGGDAPVVRGDDVTSIRPTDIRDQYIDNCWLFATGAWAETLHKNVRREDVDLSEAYWTYWAWFSRIQANDLDAGGELRVVGRWGEAVEIARTYGWMKQRDFYPEVDPESNRHEEARKVIFASMSSGRLKSTAARKDPTIVREELDRAWKLGATVVAAMDHTFPRAEPVHEPLSTRAEIPATAIHRTRDLDVLDVDGTSTVTLEDAIGELKPHSESKEGLRVGKHAWSQAEYRWSDDEEPRQRALLVNTIDALNKRLPVPISYWLSPPTAGEYRGEWLDRASLKGTHAVLAVDYQAENVPGFGTLPVGVEETREKALEAALEPEAKITLLRVKNSWGAAAVNVSGNPRNAFLPAAPGYNDLYFSYSDQKSPSAKDPQTRDQRLLTRLVLPNALRVPIPAKRD